MKEKKYSLRTPSILKNLSDANSLRNEIIIDIEQQYEALKKLFDEKELPDFEAVKRMVDEGQPIDHNHSAIIKYSEYQENSEVLEYVELLVKVLKYSQEAFEPLVEKRAVADIDRLGNMYSGPFYTSKEYPIPSINGHLLIPVIQINLASLPFLSGIYIQDGLLQLWYDMETFMEFVRVIPIAKASTTLMTEFIYQNPSETWFTPLAWSYQDDLKFSEQIVRFRSKGMCTAKSSIENCLFVMENELSESLIDKINKFMKLCCNERRTHLYGTFYPIQYSNEEMDMRCFFNIDDWGGAGNLQIFIKESNESGIEFSSRSCAR